MQWIIVAELAVLIGLVWRVAAGLRALRHEMHLERTGMQDPDDAEED
jgi:hypothetical protein